MPIFKRYGAEAKHMPCQRSGPKIGMGPVQCGARWCVAPRFSVAADEKKYHIPAPKPRQGHHILFMIKRKGDAHVSIRSRKSQARVATVTTEPAVPRLWLGLGAGLALVAVATGMLPSIVVQDRSNVLLDLVVVTLVVGVVMLASGAAGQVQLLSVASSASVRALARRLAGIGRSRSGKQTAKAGKEATTLHP